jgi:phosphoribosylglycinamide formyltransferase-1
MSAGIGSGPRTVVLVSGSGTNLQAIIEQVTSGQLAIHLCAVVSDQPRAFGLERARRAGIPDFEVPYRGTEYRPEWHEALSATLRTLQPDVVALAGFMRILPARLVQRFEGRMLNVHPSLLPKYRGLHTYRRVLEAGDQWHGSTVHFVIPALDAGPAIIQYRVRVSAEDTEATLANRVRRGEYIIYPRAIGWLAARQLRLVAGDAWLDGSRLDAPLIVEEE